MPLTIDSTRFGTIEIDPDSVVEFPHGLIGFESRRFALVAREADAEFLWLHSVEDPALAIPVTDPRRFFSSFTLELDDEELERLGLPRLPATDIYVTVRASDQLEGFTANLRAPIVIAGGRGHQVINQAAGAPLRAPLFGELAAEAANAAERAA
ncbi:flagellar assembly protein FliW [Conexibacter arvalis]|uniref:Flagellar assembly factor FliW n=1 Tax=Conexibacter arvalis TaxID=912552 RepID=A0A840I836_9ACTN|nr:flagellar assembly protein FliW [Conexibacter arvalis]MBB4661027.1 flagellar assembly factor FliW [Conexibacter arvalis]